MRRIRALDPEPDGDGVQVPEYLLGRILAEPRTRRARVRGRRPVRVAVIMGLVAAVAIAVVGLRLSQQRDDPLAALSTARVDWGMTVRVSLHPDTGVTMDDARVRLRTAIAQRARLMDAAGVVVADVAPDAVEVTLPGAQAAREVQGFLDFGRLRILDARRSLVASAPTMDALGAAVARERARRPGPTVVYVQWRGRGRPVSMPSRFPKRQIAGIARSALRSGDAIRTLEVPADMLLLADRAVGPTRIDLVRPVDLVPSSALRAATGNDAASRMDAPFRVTVDPDTALSDTPVEALVTVVGGGTGDLDETQLLARRRLSATARSVTVRGDGPSALFAAQRFGHVDLGGRIEIETPRAYGTIPPLTGPEARLDPLTIEAFAPRVTRWLEVVRSGPRRGGQTQRLVVGVRGVTPVALIEGTVGGGSGGMSGALVCGDSVGTPRVRICQAGVGSMMRIGRRLVRVDRAYGRVRPGVARIAARATDGTLVDASIRNGWFLVTADTIGPHPAGRGAQLFASPVELLAWDGQGRRVPVVWPSYG